MKKLKLIWDFRGPTASKTAQHHEKHLAEYIAMEGLNLNITGCEHLNEMHSFAFMVVVEAHMPKVRDALKPHRGEIYDGQNDS